MFSIVPRQNQEKYTKEYYLAQHANWFAHPNFPYFKKVLGMIRCRLPGKFSMLDVGCGKGDFLKYVATMDSTADLTGIDITNNSDKRVRFITGDIMKCAFRTKFDVLTAFMVIEHVDDPQAFVKRVHDLVRPGGLFICSTINNDGVMYWLARVLRKVGMRDSFDRLYSVHHLQHFSNASLRRVLEGGGFKLDSISNHNYPMNAVDVPTEGLLPVWLYRFAVRCIFGVSWLLGQGMHQTVVCRRAK